jgi:hypothetical protein
MLQGFFANGAQLKTLFMNMPPPGQLLDYLNGKIYIASGKVVWVTEPLRYGIVNPTTGYYMYAERVTLVKAVTDGFYTSSDKTYFVSEVIRGEINVRQRMLFPHKAIEGATCVMPNNADVIWFSELGFVRGTASGEATLITENQLAVDKYARGAMAYTHINGHKAITAMLQGGVPNQEISSDYVAGEVTRRAELI